MGRKMFCWRVKKVDDDGNDIGETPVNVYLVGKHLGVHQMVNNESSWDVSHAHTRCVLTPRDFDGFNSREDAFEFASELDDGYDWNFCSLDQLDPDDVDSRRNFIRRYVQRYQEKQT